MLTCSITTVLRQHDKKCESRRVMTKGKNRVKKYQSEYDGRNSDKLEKD